MLRLVIISVLLFSFASLNAQKRVQSKIPPGIMNRSVSMDSDLHLYLKGDEMELRSIVGKLDGHFKRYSCGYASVILTKSAVLELNTAEEVESIYYYENNGQALLNESRVHTRIDKLYNGTAGLPAELNGEGVIIGVIDAGLDFYHPDFLDENGKTRVLSLWDQSLDSNSLMPSYGYGSVYDSAMINDSLCPHVDFPIHYGHGTTTTGIAAGNGYSGAEYTGCAPKANIVVVATDYLLPFGGGPASIADAVDYIFSVADAYDMPCVINASLGHYVGSHDGRDPVTEEIEALITEKSGRAMVCAAGNSGEEQPYHLGYSANSDTNFTWFQTKPNANAGNGSILIDVYGETSDFDSLYFSIGADQVNPHYEYAGGVEFLNGSSSFQTTVHDSLFSLTGNYLGKVKRWSDTANGTFVTRFQIDSIDSIDYNYRLMVTGNGRFDVWSSTWGGINTNDMVYDGLPSSNAFADIERYKLPDTKQQIVSSWACSDKVITVGNYSNRNEYTNVNEETVSNSSIIPGDLAASSSAGPSRTGLRKPDVAAPGEWTLTTATDYRIAALAAGDPDRLGVGGMHERGSGTSSAAPVVAAIGAMLFQHCPNANWEDFKNALNGGAIGDQYASNLPNDEWGYGKADAVNTIKYFSPHPTIEIVEDEICLGDTVEASIPNAYESILWATNDTVYSIQVSESGVYYALLFNSLGCSGYSDTVSVVQRPVPSVPSIEIIGDNPSCANESITLFIDDEYGAYVWSTQEYTNQISVNNPGIYNCNVFNSFGCSTSSQPVLVEFYENRSAPHLVLKASDILVAQLEDTNSLQYAWRLNGELIPGQIDSSFQVESVGLYQAIVTDSNGCEWPSNEVFISLLSSNEASTQHDILVAPNPFQNAIEISGLTNDCTWILRSISGSIVQRGELSKGQNRIEFIGLLSGVYNIEIESDNLIYNQQIVKVK